MKKDNPKRKQEDPQTKKLIEDLKIYQFELETQNKELQSSRLGLQDALERYTELYEFSPVSLLTLNQQGQILECNMAAADLLGRPRSFIINKNISMFIKLNFHSLFKEYLKRILNSTVKHTFEAGFRGKKGTTIYCKMIGQSVPNDLQQKECRISLIDISLQKQKQDEIEKLNVELKQMNESLKEEVRKNNQDQKMIKQLNLRLEQQIKELQTLSTDLKDSRTAALNVMEDALQARDSLRESEEKTKRQNKIFATINTIFAKTMKCQSEEELGSDILSLLEDVTESTIAFIGEINQKTNRLDNFVISNPGWKIRNMQDQTGHGKQTPTVFPMQGLYERVLKNGEAFFTNNPTSHPDSTGISEGHPPLTSFFGFPLKENGKTIGMIGLANRKQGYTSEQIEIMKKIAPVVQQAIRYKRAEISLEKSEEQYRLAQKVSNIGSWDWTILTGGLKWSETIEPIFGFEKGAFKKTYEAFLQCLHPDDRQFVTDSVNACIEHKKEYNIEHRIIWPDGSIHWVHEIGNVIRNNEGKAVRMLGIVHDITERKKFEEEVNRLASFPEKDPNPILETDTSGSLIYINPIAQELFPDLKNAGLKHPFLKGITPQILKNLQKKPIRPLSIEVTVGNKSYLQTLCYIPENQRIHVYSMDITKLKDAEETLKQSEEKYRGIVENTTNLIMMTQPDGTISYLSPSCKKVLGYPSKDLLGKNLTIIHPDDAKKVQQTLYKSLKGEKGSGLEYRIITKQGKTKWISHSWSPIFINKKIQSVVSIIEDISNRKETENNIKELNENLLYQAIKLEATNKELEAFSYSVSHDLRAPLRSIEGFSQALLEDYEKKLDETGVDYLNRVCNATRKMSQLIEDMLKLSRLTRSEMAIDTVDLGQTAEDIINKFKQADPKRTIDFIKPGNLIVKGDPDLLTIALENLLSNAWKFTKNSKKAKIEFGKLKKEPETVFFIKDNGAGFDMKYADKLFTPFQRLHSDDDYKGTGIGLSIVSRIIHRHGGRIWAEAEENKGATFYFTLQGKNHK